MFESELNTRATCREADDELRERGRAAANRTQSDVCDAGLKQAGGSVGSSGVRKG